VEGQRVEDGAAGEPVSRYRGRRIEDLGIGLAGLGDIANTHLEAYRRRGLRVVAGADVDSGRAEAARRRWGLPRVFSGPDAVAEMVRCPEVDVVDVTVPHYREVRLPVVQAVAAAGRALQVQKPMAQTYPEAVELVEVAERAGVPFRVNQNSVFVPAFTALRECLREGTIGTPYYYQIENRGLWAMDHPHFAKRARWIISDMGVHHYALVHDWFGPPESVSAIAAHDPTQPQLVGENLGILTLRYASGLQGVIINNWAYRGGVARAHPREEIVIQGTRGAVTATSVDVEVSTVEPAARTHLPFEGQWFPDAFGHSMVEFLRALSEGRLPKCHGRDNLQVMAVIEAAYRSIDAGGRPVRLAEVTA
jgi:predicted dehydrogenase